jgi:hypothetical protein
MQSQTQTQSKIEEMNKVLSGRWILTVTSGFVFAYVAITGMIDSATTSAILTAVFTSYFQRPDRAGDANARQTRQNPAS